MSERLKQIWSGFEGTTTRNLTGRGIENIPVPPRTDYTSMDKDLVPEDFSAPASAAFASLHESLKKKEKKFAGAQKDAALPSEADNFVDATAFSAASDDLIRGLRATAMRVERPELDYGAFLSSREGKAHYKKHKRKKRFLFF